MAVIAFVLGLAANLRVRRLRRAQLAVLGEFGQADLVAHGVETRSRVEELSAGIDEISRMLVGRAEEVERRLDGSISRSAVVRYDAFNESTGRQSSSVALLDEHHNGVVISAILQREQARVYAKPIAAGSSDLELSPEEREAIKLAEESAAG